MTDRNEALRLADWHAEQAHGWRNAASLSAADKAEPVRSSLLAKVAFHDKSAALLRQQAERIAELEGERDQLRAEVERLRVEVTAARENGFRDGYEQRHAEVIGALA